MEYPLVSCLMLTYNRFSALKEAVECFTHQTYQNKQLVIMNSGTHSYHKKVEKFLENYKDYNIKHRYMSESHLTIGFLRNWAMEYCDGEFIIGFDDDDIHHRERISKQMRLCLENNIDGTILKNFTAKMGRKTYSCSIMHGLEGTLLFRNPNGRIRYEDYNQGEDTDMIYKLKEYGYNIAVISEDFDLYVYQYHNNNTVGKKHFKEMIELNPPISRN